jgi:hypothetical protein
MTEKFVNKFAIVLGPCGLGGTAYEIHGTADDLLALSEQLRERVMQFKNGTLPILEMLKRDGLELRESDPVPLFSEYVTLSQKRTDRMCLSFFVESSLAEHHVLNRTVQTSGALSLSLAKFLWYLVFPLVGIGACFWALGRFVLGVSL